jgi:rod shape determining protein RodA
MNLKNFTYFDYVLFLAVVVLSSVGVLFIYSSGVNSNGESVSYEYVKQIVWLATGVALMVAVTLMDYRRVADRALLLFGGALFVLLYTRLFGRYVNGAKSWIGIGELGIQPSEFTKIVYIIYLARYLDKSDRIESDFRASSRRARSWSSDAPDPFATDLGTASVYFPIFLAVCFVAGCRFGISGWFFSAAR